MSRAQPRFRRGNFVANAPVNSAWRLAVVGQIEQQMTVNLFYYHDNRPFSEGVNAIHANNLYNAFVAAAGPWEDLKGAISADWASVEIRVDSPTSPDFGTQIYPQGSIGLAPAGHEPTTVAAIISKHTTLKGQCGRGHLALPGVPTAWVTASKITTLTAYESLATTLLSAITTGADTFTPIVWSKGTRTNPSKGYTEIINFAVKPILGTVRRRKLGRGK